ncbi:hypothetical protein EYF80_027885 [Liparis tanakae]|uniref:Uncharacterized protein n=1 Tax=Liparis tanakae TaxID=230148 RepID=A0A4Z2H7S8_9TELE|nr:hypothetical protein EYF80_027885 [Liparis tanakae]
MTWRSGGLRASERHEEEEEEEEEEDEDSRVLLKAQIDVNHHKSFVLDSCRQSEQVFNVWLSSHIWLFRHVPSQLICQLIDARYSGSPQLQRAVQPQHIFGGFQLQQEAEAAILGGGGALTRRSLRPLPGEID